MKSEKDKEGGQRVLAGSLEALMMLLVIVLFLPTAASAVKAGGGNLGKTLELGGG